MSKLHSTLSHFVNREGALQLHALPVSAIPSSHFLSCCVPDANTILLCLPVLGPGLGMRLPLDIITTMVIHVYRRLDFMYWTLQSRLIINLGPLLETSFLFGFGIDLLKACMNNSTSLITL